MTLGGDRPAWQLVQWGPEADRLPLDRAGHSATVVGSKIYVFGGRKGSLFFNDLLCFDTRTCQWSRPVPKCPFRPRANHTATLVGSCVWVVGGSDAEEVLADAVYLDLGTNTWHNALVLDPQQLLARCAHAAEVHPRRPATIIVMGGYGPVSAPAPGQQPYNMNNDLLLLHTDRLEVERVVVFNSVPPAPRAYHSLTVVGDRAYVFGGRDMEGVVSGASLLAVYDVLQNAWISPAGVAGAPPSPRSSHRAVAYNGRVVLYGGAGEGRGHKERMADVHSLVVLPGGQALAWSSCDSPAPPAAAGGDAPQGRSAHTMSLVQDVLYVTCGYAGASTCKKYARDCWALRLLPDAYDLWAPVPRGIKAGAALLAGTRRSRSPQPQPPPSPAAEGGASAPGAAAAIASAGVSVGGDSSGGWHTAKRKRSGSAGGVAQPQGHQQLLPQLQQLPDEQRGAPCAPQAPLIPPPAQQPPQQQQQAQQLAQQQQQPAGRLEAQAAAVAAALATTISESMRASPPPAGDGAAGKYQRDHLRGLLQQQYSRTSSLEGENRQLTQQLSELKRERARSEQLLAQVQEELVRNRLAAEQERVQRQRKEEDAEVLVQQVEAERACRRKVEVQCNQQQNQVQALGAESRRLQTQLAEAERDRRVAQEQLQQLQEQRHRNEERREAERAAQQQALSDMSSALEQHKNELRRLNDSMAEEKRKHETLANTLRAEAAARTAELQEKSRLALELQQQLDAARTAQLEEHKRADSFQQLHATSTAQLNTLRSQHNALAADNARLEGELARVKEDQERLRSELEARASVSANVRAAMLQMQNLSTQVLNALGSR